MSGAAAIATTLCLNFMRLIRTKATADAAVAFWYQAPAAVRPLLQEVMLVLDAELNIPVVEVVTILTAWAVLKGAAAKEIGAQAL